MNLSIFNETGVPEFVQTYELVTGALVNYTQMDLASVITDDLNMNCKTYLPRAQSKYIYQVVVNSNMDDVAAYFKASIGNVTYTFKIYIFATSSWLDNFTFNNEDKAGNALTVVKSPVGMVSTAGDNVSEEVQFVVIIDD
jgi:hypothetical protein